MGWISQFLSKAVITGFLAGAAVDVVIGELPKLTGTDAEGDNSWRELGTWLGSLGDVHGTTLLVGVLSLAVILGLRFLAPAVPGALVLVAGGILARALFDLGAHGVALVGDVPSGLPAPVMPDLALVGDHAATIAIAAFALVLIGFSQTAGDARAFAARHKLPDRRRPGVGRAGDGERRRRRVPGHAGLDQPVGQLAERVGRGADADGVARSPARSCCSRCSSSRRSSRTSRRPCSAP